jgi:cytochrome c peroxidase
VFSWNLPRGFPEPQVPESNPMSHAKVRLGRHLFYDPRLSQDGSMSCASCHRQELAFTDGRATSPGVSGQHTPRSAMSLANTAYAATLTWANPLLTRLERQALVPLFGDAPAEMGNRSEEELLERLAATERYASLFQQAFPAAEQRVTLQHVVQALAAFQRTLISGSSPYDRWLAGDERALSASAKRGYALFNGERLECFHCHGGFAFTDHVTYAENPFPDAPYHNTGLYNLGRRGAYPEPNTGVFAVTLAEQDMGAFKAPTLRNVAVTAPYMHDGSVPTLDAAIDHYQRAGRLIKAGPYAGDGSKSPLKDPLLRGFELTPDERPLPPGSSSHES